MSEIIGDSYNRPVILSCPLCRKCGKIITNGYPGVWIWGNVNVVNTARSDADGGGIIGWNFPSNTAVGKLELSEVSKMVRKEAYHLTCLVGVLEAGIKEGHENEVREIQERRGR